MGKRRKYREYQARGERYAVRVGHPAWYEEMRLGKTIQAIRTAVERWFAKRILVVAPMSALLSWEEELELEGEKDVAFLTGSLDKRRKLLREDHKWYLLNKEGHLSFRDVEQHGRYKYVWWDRIFTEHPWDVVYIDESTCIKNPKADITKCYTRNFRDVSHRGILCGLPNPEGPLDFFCQFLFLDGGETFGKNFWTFRKRKFYQAGFQWKPKKGTKKWMEQKVKRRAFIVRREHVGLDQPMVLEKRHVELPSRLRRTYRMVEEQFVLEHEGREINKTVYKIVAYTWLRHLASGFLEEELLWKGKVDLLFELLEGELQGEKLVIWFDYNEGLFACRRALLREHYTLRTVYGKGKKLERRKRALRAWKKDRAQILLAQCKSIQYGENLSKAQTQIYFTCPLGGELRKQTEERILVAGRKTPLLTIDLITRGTVEEDIYKMIREKNQNSISLLDACSAIKRRRKRK